MTVVKGFLSYVEGNEKKIVIESYRPKNVILHPCLSCCFSSLDVIANRQSNLKKSCLHISVNSLFFS